MHYLAKSLNEEQREALYGKLFLPVNLNTASEDEMKLIPGVGNRMAHEFDEYRPYKALAQFRREIGKYVDDDEVARLEQYVFIPIDLNAASDERYTKHSRPGQAHAARIQRVSSLRQYRAVPP